MFKLVASQLTGVEMREAQVRIRKAKTGGDSRGWRGSHGQSLVEFALLLPVLTWVLLGVVDFGRLYYDYVTVTNASRVGAMYAMDPRRSIADVREVIKRESSSLNITDADITLTPNPAWSAGSDLTVQVRTKFEAVTPLISSLWGGGPLTLTASTVTRFNSP